MAENGRAPQEPPEEPASATVTRHTVPLGVMPPLPLGTRESRSAAEVTYGRGLAPWPAAWTRYAGVYRLPGVARLDIRVVDNALVAVAANGGRVVFRPEGGRAFRMEGGPLAGQIAVFAPPDHTGVVPWVQLGSYVFERV